MATICTIPPSKNANENPTSYCSPVKVTTPIRRNKPPKGKAAATKSALAARTATASVGRGARNIRDIAGNPRKASQAETGPMTGW